LTGSRGKSGQKSHNTPKHKILRIVTGHNPALLANTSWTENR
jgi:hypothetical protein